MSLASTSHAPSAAMCSVAPPPQGDGPRPRVSQPWFFPSRLSLVPASLHPAAPLLLPRNVPVRRLTPRCDVRRPWHDVFSHSPAVPLDGPTARPRRQIRSCRKRRSRLCSTSTPFELAKPQVALFVASPRAAPTVSWRFNRVQHLLMLFSLDAHMSRGGLLRD